MADQAEVFEQGTFLEEVQHVGLGERMPGVGAEFKGAKTPEKTQRPSHRGRESKFTK